MPRFKLTLEYEGTRYNGWQFQKSQPTVQGKLFEACQQVFETQKYELYGAGRTDSGVHALGQVAHLDVQTKLKPDAMRIKLNDKLPSDICINTIEHASQNFHARHDATARSYVYQISCRRTAFGKPYIWWVKDSLNVEKMQDAARLFVGFKDFCSFGNDDPEVKSTEVEINHLNVVRQGESIFVHIIGSHFLWRMVRRVVGVLVEVGRGRMNEEDVQLFFDTHSAVPAQFTAPPSGLYLERVYYGNEELDASFIYCLNI